LLEWVLLNIDRKAITVAKAITLLREAERSGNGYAFIFKDTVDDLTDQQREVLSVLASKLPRSI
jgi:predicted DNA binding protein